MGAGLLEERLAKELALLRSRFPDTGYREDGHWFLLAKYPGPPAVWTNPAPDICFQVSTGYPGQKPYAFYIRQPFELMTGGEVRNTTPSAEPPYEGVWVKFSWDIPDWRATDDLTGACNLLNWALSFRARLEEGG